MPPTWSSTPTNMSRASKILAPTASDRLMGTIDRDVAVPDPPTDSISELSWSPKANLLAASSWDHLVRVYDQPHQPTGRGLASIAFDKPVLSCHFSTNGQAVVGGSLDRTARLIDLAANGAPAQQVAAHDDAVKAVRFFDAPSSSAPMLATASWDRTVKYWDLRSATPAATLQLPERVYSMDVVGHNLIAATPDNIYHVDLTAPTVIAKTLSSSLRKQPRVVACLGGEPGFAVAGTDGRIDMQYFALSKKDESFSWRCHRMPRPAPSRDFDVYPINSISRHPTKANIIASAAANGTFHFWDIRKRATVARFPNVGHALSAGAFNGDGALYAYAVSYDWSKGYAGYTPSHPNKIMIHKVGADECGTDDK